MPLHDCPGPDRKKASTPEEVKCPHCGADLEMWTNETKMTCASCSKEVTREQLPAGR
ncbi:hypothetical protein HQ590_01550 [bacterium]|nr:hypothetical protein [bacterium]